MPQSRLLHLLVLVGLALPARAGSPLPAPVMLGDLHPGTTEELGAISNLSVSADTAYFWHPSPYNGQEVPWRSDGTPGGTYPLGDRFPAELDTWPNFNARSFFTFGSHTFFLAGSESGAGLWKTDGTPAGTILVRGWASHGGQASFAPVSMGGAFYFLAAFDGSGQQLWKSDGTPAGTVHVKDLDRNAGGLTVLGNTLFVVTSIPFVPFPPTSLWKSDGTEVGTVKLQEFPPEFRPRRLVAAGSTLFLLMESSSSPAQLWKIDGTSTGLSKLMDVGGVWEATALGGRLLFTTSSALWTSDGTPGGTVQLAAMNQPQTLRLLGDQALVFTDSGLWRTDGTPTGTVQLTEEAFPFYEDWKSTVLDGQLFFPIRAIDALELWKSDGTVAGTHKVTQVPARVFVDFISSSVLAVLGGEVFFFVEGEDEGVLWASNGTAEGTRRVYTVREPGFLLHGSPRVFRGKLLLSITLQRRYSSSFRYQHWVTDGTAAGTVPLRHEPTPLGSRAEPLEPAGTTLLFFAKDEAHGAEPWKTDGTSAGTTLVKDIRPGPDSGTSLPTLSSSASYVTGSSARAASARVGDTLYFVADDGVHGQELWKSDGTEAGTVLVKDIRPGLEPGVLEPGLQAMGRTVYFIANDGVHGQELWKSDGTEAGTVLVKDIHPGLEHGPTSGIGGPLLTPLGGALLFTADDGVHGQELWKSDGTEAGTVLVKDIHPGASWSGGEWLLESRLGEVLYFLADDGVHGRKLWRSDGTEAGTWLLLPPEWPGTWITIPPPTAANGALYFSVLDAARGLEVWKSDGTQEGTRPLKLLQAAPFAPPRLALAAAFFTAVKDQVFFVGFDSAHGYELWKTDGTEAGTVRVTDLNAGPASAMPLADFGPSPLLALEEQGLLLFAASDGVHGVEPWVTDGTEAGTSLVADLNPGVSSSLAGSFQRFGDRVFFSADDGVHGMEPWRLELQPEPEPGDGCGGCQSTGAPGMVALWGLMVLAGWGSRRRRP